MLSWFLLFTQYPSYHFQCYYLLFLAIFYNYIYSYFSIIMYAIINLCLLNLSVFILDPCMLSFLIEHSLPHGRASHELCYHFHLVTSFQMSFLYFPMTFVHSTGYFSVFKCCRVSVGNCSDSFCVYFSIIPKIQNVTWSLCIW